MKRRLPRSLRKHIRQEKARIRREVLDIKEQEKLIQELYQKPSFHYRVPIYENEGGKEN